MKQILEQILAVLTIINNRQYTNDLLDVGKPLEKDERTIETALLQLQNSFDRTHDKIFNFNNILIGIYLVIGTLPNFTQKIGFWDLIVPMVNLVLLIYIEIKQMAIHRFRSKLKEWEDSDMQEYPKKIARQNLLSLLSLIITLFSFFNLVKLIFYYE